MDTSKSNLRRRMTTLPTPPTALSSEVAAELAIYIRNTLHQRTVCSFLFQQLALFPSARPFIKVKGTKKHEKDTHLQELTKH